MAAGLGNTAECLLSGRKGQSLQGQGRHLLSVLLTCATSGRIRRHSSLWTGAPTGSQARRPSAFRVARSTCHASPNSCCARSVSGTVEGSRTGCRRCRPGVPLARRGTAPQGSIPLDRPNEPRCPPSTVKSPREAQNPSPGCACQCTLFFGAPRTRWRCPQTRTPDEIHAAGRASHHRCRGSTRGTAVAAVSSRRAGFAATAPVSGSCVPNIVGRKKRLNTGTGRCCFVHGT